jgi:hypothetical protein
VCSRNLLEELGHCDQCRVEQLSHDAPQKVGGRPRTHAKRDDALCTKSVRINKCLLCIPQLSPIHTNISHQSSRISTTGQSLSSASQHAAPPSRSLLHRRFFLFHSHLPRGAKHHVHRHISILVVQHVSASIAPRTPYPASRYRTMFQG